MKKIISLLLCVALAFSLIPIGMISTSAASVTVYFHYMFKLPGDTANHIEQGRTQADGIAVPTANMPDRDDEGLEFVAWYWDEDFTQRFDFSKPVTSATHLYARWADADDVCTVTWYEKAKDQTPYNVTKAVKGEPYGEMPILERDGEKFTGWCTDKELSSDSYYSGETPLTGDTTLYGAWRFFRVTWNYMCYIDDNSPSYYTEIDETSWGGYVMNVGETAYPVREGLVLYAWYTEPTFENKFDFQEPIDAPITLYARWVERDKLAHVMVYFDERVPSVDGHVAYNEYHFLGETFEPDDGWIDGFVFAGNYTDPEFENKYVPAPLTGDVTIYQKYVSEDDCCNVWIYLDPSYEEPTAGVSVPYGEAYGMPAEPGRDGETFIGWYTDRALTRKYDPNKPITEETSLFPRFVRDEDVCNVYIYNSVNDNKYDSVVKVAVNDCFDEPDFIEPDGWNFFGWYTDRALTKPYDPTVPITEDISLFPRLLSDADCRIVWIYLDPSYEEPTAGVSVPYGEAYGMPAEPGREGGEFKGWFTDRALTKPYDPTAPITVDTSLFPKFYYKTPSIASLRNTWVGVEIKIKDDVNASKFRVYRKAEGETSWAVVGDTTSHSLIDGRTVSGKTYTYTVRCVDAAGKAYQSAYNTKGWTITYYDMPFINSITPHIKGLNIKWTGSNGVYGYRVFRKNGKSWKTLTTTTSTSYIDTTVVSGNEYTYTVRGVDKNGNYITDYEKLGDTAAYVAAPKISAVTNTTAGAKLAWSKSNGAAKYRVFVKSGTSGWKKLADTASTSYTHTKAASGTKYTYTVRALDMSGSYASAYDTAGVANVYIATPALPTLKNTKLGVQIISTMPKGAVKYAVFRKEAGATKWTRVITNIAASKKIVVDSTAKNGKKYTYTIRCLSANGKSYVSDYNRTGKTITCKR